MEPRLIMQRMSPLARAKVLLFAEQLSLCAIWSCTNKSKLVLLPFLLENTQKMCVFMPLFPSLCLCARFVPISDLA